jgi:WD repeat-containing protein 19
MPQVRKPKDGSREDEAPVLLSACPLSGALIPTTALECPTTKDPLPMCVVTGQHVTSDDLCLCPRSGMPALFSHYLRHIDAELSAASAAEGGSVALDPVTERPVAANELVRLSKEEAAAYIAKHNMDKDEAPPKPKTFAPSTAKS